MTLRVYEDWMEYTEPDKEDFWGRIKPKPNAPDWVQDKIDQYYKEIEELRNLKIEK